MSLADKTPRPWQLHPFGYLSNQPRAASLGPRVKLPPLVATCVGQRCPAAQPAHVSFLTAAGIRRQTLRVHTSIHWSSNRIRFPSAYSNPRIPTKRATSSGN